MKVKIVLGLLALGGLLASAAPQMAAFQDRHPMAMAAAETEFDAGQAKEVAVSLSDFKYSPKLLKVKVGTKVTWTNKENVPHTVDEDKGAFESGNMTNGASFSFTFDKPGTYRYHCAFHGGKGGEGMSGTVKVTK